MATNFLYLFSPHLSGDAGTADALQSMSSYYTLTKTTWKQDYDHVVNWCNLANYLYNHKSLKLCGEMLFTIDSHESDCYWYEVLWRCLRLSDRTIRDAVDALRLQDEILKTDNDTVVLKQHQDKIKQVIGCVSFIVDEIEGHCSYAKEDMESEWDQLNDSRVTLRVIGYWVTAALLNSAKAFYGATKITLPEESESEHRGLVNRIHSNAKIQCHLILGFACEQRNEYGYAVAHYRAASALGCILNTSQQDVQRRNTEIYMQALPPSELDLLAVALKVPSPMFVQGDPVIRKVAFVFK